MKVSFDVIKDLIPLYVEDMLSEDSRKLVEEHLDECPEQMQYIEDYLKEKNENKTSIKNIENEEVLIKDDRIEERKNLSNPIKKIKKNLRTFMLKIVFCVLSVAGFIATLVFPLEKMDFSYEDSYKKAKPIIEFIDGQIVFKTDVEITGMRAHISPSKLSNKKIVSLSVTSYKSEKNKNIKYDKVKNLNSFLQVENPEKEVGAIYYVDYENTKLERLYGEEKYDDEIDNFWKPGYMRNLILYLLASTLILLTLAIILRKIKFINWIVLLIFFASLAGLIVAVLYNFGFYQSYNSEHFNTSRLTKTILGIDMYTLNMYYELALLPFLSLVSSFILYKHYKKIKM